MTEGPTAAGRRRNPRGQGDRLRDDLIEAALGLMAETGDPEDISIRAVAKAAGVTPTAAYRHFADRDSLIAAACEANFLQFSTRLAEWFADEDDPFERLVCAGRGYLAFATGDPGRYRVLFSNPITQSLKKEYWPEVPAGDTAFVQLIELVQGCLDAGAQTRTDDATYLAFQVWTWIHGIVDLRITHPMMEFPDADLMLVGVVETLGLVRPNTA